HKTRGIAALLDGPAPVVVLIALERSEIVLQNIRQAAAPAVTTIVGMKPVAHGEVRGPLHRYIKRGVDTQSAFMHGFGSVSRFQIFSNFLEKIGCQIIARIL